MNAETLVAEPLVDADWIAAHLTDETVRIIEVDVAPPRTGKATSRERCSGTSTPIFAVPTTAPSPRQSSSACSRDQA